MNRALITCELARRINVRGHLIVRLILILRLFLSLPMAFSLALYLVVILALVCFINRPVCNAGTALVAGLRNILAQAALV